MQSNNEFFDIFPVRSDVINLDKLYFIYYVENTSEQNEIVTNDLEELQKFKELLKSKIPFASKISHLSDQYRIGIPKSLIKNKLIDPIKEVEYWIYIVD